MPFALKTDWRSHSHSSRLSWICPRSNRRFNGSSTNLSRSLCLILLFLCVSSQLEENISQTQRRYMLMEQLKAIKKELGLEREDKDQLVKKFRDRLAELKVPEHASKVIEEEMVCVWSVCLLSVLITSVYM